MCSVIGQRDRDRVHILDELALPDSRTWHTCEAFLERIGSWGRLSPHTTSIDIYGDATGGGRHTSASFTDWQMVRDFFKRLPYPVRLRVPTSNPPVKDRTNSVNSMLCTQAGERRLRIDPGCKQLILDFERVHWKVDLNGNTLNEIDGSDPMRTHVSDALGYMIAQEFPIHGKAGEMRYSPR
jgi:hypothetical protein